MKTESNDSRVPTRRDVLRQSFAASAAISLPWIVSSRALGRAGMAAASERITLGVIGIGPRCTYDLRSILALPDVQCVAICDVQASRREAGKALVDGHYKNKNCLHYRDFRELLARQDIDAVLIATGDRWHALTSILAARAGKDVQREALRLDHRRLPGPGRHHEPFRPGLPGRHPAAQRRQFPARRAACPQRQARQATHPPRLGLHARQRLQLAACGTGALPG